MAGVSIVYSQVLADFDVTAWGAADWAFWGSGSSSTNVAPSQRKSGGGSTVGNYTCTVASLDFSAGASPFNFVWTGGTPTASGSSKDLLYNTLNGGGSSTTGADGSVTLPADTTSRVAFLLLDAYNSTVTLTATLSDGSAGPAVNATQVNNPYNGGGNLYEVTYSAASAGQTLTLRAVAATNGAYSDVEPRAAGWKYASAGTSLTPGTAALTLAGQVPNVARTANQSLSPAQKAISLTGFAPTVARTANQGVSPAQGAITLTGLAPTVTQTAGLNLAPAAASLAITGLSPTVARTANQTVTLTPGVFSLQGFAPTVVQASASVDLTPGAGYLTITGYAPILVQTGSDPYPLGSGGGPLEYFPSQAEIRERARRERAEAWVLEEREITRKLKRGKRKALPVVVERIDIPRPVLEVIPRKPEEPPKPSPRADLLAKAAQARLQDEQRRAIEQRTRELAAEQEAKEQREFAIRQEAEAKEAIEEQAKREHQAREKRRRNERIAMDLAMQAFFE